MSTSTMTQAPEISPVGHEVVKRRGWKLPITYGIATLLLLYFTLRAEGVATYRLAASDNDRIQIPDFSLNSATVCLVLTLLSAAMCAYSIYRTLKHRPSGGLPAVMVGLSVVLGFLTWYGGGSVGTITITALLASALALSTPLIFGSLSGVVAERVGVVNIAIEGQLLIGAFCGVVVATLTNSPWIGLLAAGLGGMLVGVLLAFFAIQYNIDQIIIGVVLNALVLGLTTFFFSTTLSERPQELNSAAVNMQNLKIPIVSDIPIIGPVLFNQTPLVYIMYAVVILLTIYLFRSRWGLRLRAVGEHPHAADTVGIDVRKTRWKGVLLSGAIAGFGGAYFTIGASVGHSFTQNMSAGNGYIALAAMILGKWHPVGAAAAALMFGLANAISILLPTLELQAPSSLISMIPYLVTIFAVAGFVGRSRPPASENMPYFK
ncbi:ABC transporter permease [Actinobaculum suis]|uniref:ABC transporter permease n=1 Tax=Actinobaculum suis TaxID=1657 RepID=UPI000ACE6CF0|nr:ABC transporter permease [Actinobaculum suis]